MQQPHVTAAAPLLPFSMQSHAEALALPAGPAAGLWHHAAGLQRHCSCGLLVSSLYRLIGKSAPSSTAPLAREVCPTTHLPQQSFPLQVLG